MNHFPEKDASLLVLRRDEELIASLTAFAKEQHLPGAWLSGVGGADSVTLGFYNIATKSYEWRTYNKQLEIVSLTGNLVMVDGEPFWHVHGVFSGRDFQAVGGHVREMVVGLTAELFITQLTSSLTRQYDAVTGLKLICPA